MPSDAHICVSNIQNSTNFKFTKLSKLLKLDYNFKIYLTRPAFQIFYPGKFSVDSKKFHSEIKQRWTYRWVTNLLSFFAYFDFNMFILVSLNCLTYFQSSSFFCEKRHFKSSILASIPIFPLNFY